jgi:ectoine utilization protein EutC
MAAIRVLTEPEIRRLVSLDHEVVDAVRGAFVALSAGGVEMPPIISLRVPRYRGEVDVKTAFVPDIPHIAVKISPGYFDNPRIGLPSLNGLMVALDATTGIVSAILLDNGYLTTVRTAAAGAVAADLLARRNARVAAVFGTGMQAWQQVQALRLVRPIEEIRVWGRRAEAARSMAERLRRESGLAAEAFDDPREAVRHADVIVTATPSEMPVVNWTWLAPGQHVTAMGSDAPGKNELDPAIVANADRYVPDRLSQCVQLGELRAAVAAALVPANRAFPELGDVLRGAAPGRITDADITVCDLTGTGVQDTVMADLALRRAQGTMVGVLFDTDRGL